MKFYSLIIDDFFDKPDDIRQQILTKGFSDLVSPFDNVTYPDICIDLSSEMKAELHRKLESLIGVKISKSVEFCRLSKKGVKAPHQAHTDTIMGQYTALIYLNLPEHCQGGTTLLKHETGMEFNPATDREVDLWKQDTNDESKWVIQTVCPMKYNRLFLVDSNLFHRAEPLEGFGENKENGRMVMICFFNVEAK